jgi:hypothetical protein
MLGHSVGYPFSATHFPGHCFRLIPASRSFASSAFPVPPLPHWVPSHKAAAPLKAEAFASGCLRKMGQHALMSETSAGKPQPEAIALRPATPEAARLGRSGGPGTDCWANLVPAGTLRTPPSATSALLPSCPSSTKNGEGLLLQLKSAADFVRAVEWTASRPSYG